MQISAEKSKILVNSIDNHSSTNIMLDGEKLEEVDNFKYLGSIITSDGTSVKEVKTRLSLASSAMTRLNIIWRKQNISFPVKIKLYKSLVISVLLYGCESWTLNAETERRIQSFEFRCYRKLLGIKYTEHRTNSYVEQEIKAKAGKQEPLLSTVRRRKLAWFGHVTRHNNLAKTILQGSVHGQRKRGRPRKAWFDNIK